MEYDKYHSLVNVVDKNINIAFVHRELLSATWYANADRAYPENLEVKQFAQHLSPIPKVMLNLSIKEGNDSNQVLIVDSDTVLKPTGDGNVGGYIYNSLEGLIKINHAGKDISGVPYNEY
ncbi:hypothetical protein KKE26_04175 [bacterium]|nr:hypothetical protein [bacterium]